MGDEPAARRSCLSQPADSKNIIYKVDNSIVLDKEVLFRNSIFPFSQQSTKCVDVSFLSQNINPFGKMSIPFLKIDNNLEYLLIEISKGK